MSAGPVNAAQNTLSRCQASNDRWAAFRPERGSSPVRPGAARLGAASASATGNGTSFGKRDQPGVEGRVQVGGQQQAVVDVQPLGVEAPRPTTKNRSPDQQPKQ